MPFMCRYHCLAANAHMRTEACRTYHAADGNNSFDFDRKYHHTQFILHNILALCARKCAFCMCTCRRYIATTKQRNNEKRSIWMVRSFISYRGIMYIFRWFVRCFSWICRLVFPPPFQWQLTDIILMSVVRISHCATTGITAIRQWQCAAPFTRTRQFSAGDLVWHMHNVPSVKGISESTS